MLKKVLRLGLLKSPSAGGLLYTALFLWWILITDWLIAKITSHFPAFGSAHTIRHWVYATISGTLVFLLFRWLGQYTKWLEGTIDERTGDLRRDQERLTLAIESADLGTWDWDIRNRQFFWSPRCYELFGLEAGSLVEPRDFVAAVHPDDREHAREAVRRCLKGEPRYNIEVRIFRPDGSIRWLNSHGLTHYDSEGRATRISGIVGDITKRKAAETALCKSEMRYRNIIETAQEGVLVCDKNYKITMANRKTAEILGRDTEELLGKNVLDIVPEEHRIEVQANLKARKLGPQRAEYWTYHQDGNPIYLQVNGSPIFDENGNIDGFLGMLSDQTESKMTEEALRKSEERFQLSSLASRDIIWDWDIVNDRVWYSERFWEAFGYDPASFDMSSHGWADLVHPDDGWVIPPQYSKYTSMQYRLRRADGSWAYVLDRAYLITDADGNRIRKIGILSDISEARQSERALRQSEARYRNLFERNLAAVFRSTLNGVLLECNEAALKLLGYDSFEEMYALDMRGFYQNPVDRDSIIKTLCEQGQLLSVKLNLRRKDNKIVTVLANLSAIFEFSGQPPSVEGTMIDITELTKLQDELAQVQKMEAVGKLAGGVAHDFNNLLMVMNSYSELALGRITDQKAKQHIERAVEATHRAAKLTAQLLAFSRKQVIEPKILDLNNVVSDMEKMLPRLVRENIIFELKLQERLKHCKADLTQVQQVIMNLVVNARDAMPEGGHLLIETTNVDLSSGATYDHVDVPPGPYVILSVHDTGVGMDHETKERIFEPFFTTKEMGRGTGLGLSTVYGIVKQSGGYVFVDSEIGRGTTFRIFLPALEETAPSNTENISVEDQVTGSATILFVEDEAALREAGAEFLQTSGYKVIASSDAQDALRTAQEFPHKIDAIITDVIMPGLSGTELAKRVRTTRPDIKILFMSGYTENQSFQNYLESGCVFLQKPFSFHVLAKKISEMLGTASGTVQADNPSTSSSANKEQAPEYDTCTQRSSQD